MMRIQSAALVSLVVAVFAVLGILYIRSVPLWESPDEPTTFSAAHAVAKVHRMPTYLEQPLYPGVLLNAKRHPPLYFLLAGAFLSINDDLRPEIQANERGLVSAEIPHYLHGDGFPADDFPGAAFIRYLRMFSILFGVLTLIVVWRCARLLAGTTHLAAFLGITVFGLTPTFVFSHAAIDPISLSILMASLITYLLLKLYLAEEPRSRIWRILSVLLVLGLATRVTLVFFYIPALWLIFRAPRQRRIGLAGQLIIPLLLGIAWMLILAPGPSAHSFRLLGGLLLRVDSSVVSFGGLRTLMVNAKNSFWARFGWADLYAPARLLDILDLYGILTVAGFGIFLRRHRPKGLLMLGLVTLLGIAGFLRANLSQFDPQGRFLQLIFAGYAPLAGMGLATLFVRVARRRIRIAVGAFFLLSMIGINAYCLTEVIRPAYLPSTRRHQEVEAFQEQGAFVYGGVSAGQSFICRKPGLCRVEFYITPARLSEANILEFRLFGSTMLADPLAIARVPYPGPEDSPYVGFDFGPIWESQDRSYYVEVCRFPAMAPISIYHTLEDRYMAGARYADESPAPGDLRFTTYVAALPTPEE